MNMEEFLNQYDIQEGDLLECENGEVYACAPHGDNYFHFVGPQPNQTRWDFNSVTPPPKRLLRPRWKGLDTNGLVCWLHLEVLQPKQQKKTLKCEKCEEHIRCVRCGARFGISEPYYVEPYIADKRYPQHCTTCADILFKTNLDRVNWRCLNHE